MPGGNPGIPEAESGHFVWSRRDLASLAGWGAMVEVTEPRAVQAELARIGAELAAQYGPPGDRGT